jgi:hypothetical protein
MGSSPVRKGGPAGPGQKLGRHLEPYVNFLSESGSADDIFVKWSTWLEVCSDPADSNGRFPSCSERRLPTVALFPHFEFGQPQANFHFLH